MPLMKLKTFLWPIKYEHGIILIDCMKLLDIVHVQYHATMYFVWQNARDIIKPLMHLVVSYN